GRSRRAKDFDPAWVPYDFERAVHELTDDDHDGFRAPPLGARVERGQPGRQGLGGLENRDSFAAMNRIFAVAVVLIGAALVIWMPLRDGGAGTHASAGTKPAKAAPASGASTATDMNADIDACIAGAISVAARRQTRGAPAAPGEPSDAAVVARACAPLFR